MQDVEIIGMLKSYVSSTLSGMGALKGASCQIQSITDSGTTHTIVFEWEDNNGTSHTSTLEFDSTDELSKLTDITVTNLEDGQVLAYDSTTQKWVNTTNSATVQSIDNIGDVTITSIADGQFLKWDDTAQKWVNGDISFSEIENTPTTIAGYGITDAYSKTEVDSALSNKADSATTLSGYGITDSYTKTETDTLLSAKADSATTLSGYGITDAYTKTEADSAITTAIEALDVTDSATAGSYVTTVSETDGKIAVTKEAADSSPTASSKKMVTSGGVYTDTQNVYKANGMLGAKNLLPNTASTQEVSEVTFTVNTDGSVTVNGTSTGTAYINVGSFTFENGKSYILSGCPSGGSASSYSLYAYSNSLLGRDIGDGVTIEGNGDTADIRISVPNGVTVSSLTFYPMLRLASDTDSTYQPYSMTNQNITEAIESGELISDSQWTQLQTLFS